MKKTLFLSFLFCLLGMSLTFAQETDFNGDADFSEEEFRQNDEEKDWEGGYIAGYPHCNNFMISTT